MAHDAIGAHARDELGITETLRARPIQAAFASALSFAVATAPNAAAPTASANRLAAEIALECSVTSRDIGDLLRDNGYLRRCSPINALISFASSRLSAILGIFG